MATVIEIGGMFIRGDFSSKREGIEEIVHLLADSGVCVSNLKTSGAIRKAIEETIAKLDRPLGKLTEIEKDVEEGAESVTPADFQSAVREMIVKGSLAVSGFSVMLEGLKGSRLVEKIVIPPYKKDGHIFFEDADKKIREYFVPHYVANRQELIESLGGECSLVIYDENDMTSPLKKYPLPKGIYKVSIGGERFFLEEVDIKKIVPSAGKMDSVAEAFAAAVEAARKSDSQEHITVTFPSGSVQAAFEKLYPRRPDLSDFLGKIDSIKEGDGEGFFRVGLERKNGMEKVVVKKRDLNKEKYQGMDELKEFMSALADELGGDSRSVFLDNREYELFFKAPIE